MAEERIEMPSTPEIIEPKDGSLQRSSTGRTTASSCEEQILPHYLRASTGTLLPSLLSEMAEERIEMPLTPEIVEPKDDITTGRTDTASYGTKILPHYLRASTGSCHDFCKYGKEHAFEAKEKHPMLKGKKITSNEGQNPINVCPQTRKKKLVVKLAPSQDPGTQSCDAPEINKHETKLVNQKPVSPAKKAANVVKSSVAFKPKHDTEKSSVSPVNSPRDGNVRRITNVKTGRNSDPSKIAQKMPSSPLISPRDQSMRRNVKAGRNGTTSKVTQKMPSSPLSSPRDTSARRDTDVKTSRNSDTSKIGQKKDLVLQKATSYPKPSFNRTTSLKTRKYRVLKGPSPLRNENKAKQDESKLPIDENVSEKILYVIEPKPESKSLELGPTEHGSLGSLSPSSSSSPPPSLALHEKEEHIESEYDQTETTDSECDETETDSEYYETDTDSEYDETENQNHLETSKEEYKRRPRRTSTDHPEDNDPGHKLKFRRGKVVDLQSENNAPRRLRFRKGRVLGDNEKDKGSVRRENLKKREVVEAGNTGEPESEMVVLRHQDVNGKKDAQGLFNNVIEETATKLAETRKSKVKALVGAFETVISLQESKISSTRSW